MIVGLCVCSFFCACRYVCLFGQFAFVCVFVFLFVCDCVFGRVLMCIVS